MSANFGAVVEAICGLVVVLSAQFMNEDFHPDTFLLLESGPSDAFESAIGSYFLISYPNDWPTADRYDFNWSELEKDLDPFQNLVFGPRVPKPDERRSQ